MYMSFTNIARWIHVKITVITHQTLLDTWEMGAGKTGKEGEEGSLFLQGTSCMPYCWTMPSIIYFKMWIIVLKVLSYYRIGWFLF